ncbi:DUF4249 domain-containing protein [Hymenobacter psoromatis]|uniref:DUF4249 domain-containing protein n=1 Tax=Hymenobacter psoromatis TaxID=1484116 RepID=UPI001CBF89EB|nr:DUF4249 domain-containing protein [Hymenobacter psoromatis]
MLLLQLASCVKPYNAPVPAAAKSYLVVDGYIRTNGPSTFRLSRTLGLTASQPQAESQAKVLIEDDLGNDYSLSEQPAGTYTLSQPQPLDSTRHYKLRVTTAGGAAYASDLVPVQLTPPIDTVSWNYTGEGVQIAVSTHGAPGRPTTFYRWDYQETWLYTSAFYSHLVYNKDSSEFVRRNEDIYHCWNTAGSNTINLGSTAALAQDVLSRQPLGLILNKSVKLRIRYSILVLQYGQTADEYKYWETLKKNTENIGSLYDALPTQLTGNLHNVADPAEPVLGYVGAHSVRSRRIFIDRTELPLPSNWLFETGYESCGKMPDVYSPFEARGLLIGDKTLPIDPAYNEKGAEVGYLGASADCVDCRARGGSNLRPSFWR